MDATTISDRHVQAVRVMRIHCGRMPVYLNRFFGPAMRDARADVLTALHSGCRVPRYKAAWGVFCDEVFGAFGPASWACLADREDKTEAAINAFP